MFRHPNKCVGGSLNKCSHSPKGRGALVHIAGIDRACTCRCPCTARGGSPLNGEHPQPHPQGLRSYSMSINLRRRRFNSKSHVGRNLCRVGKVIRRINATGFAPDPCDISGAAHEEVPFSTTAMLASNVSSPRFYSGIDHPAADSSDRPFSPPSACLRFWSPSFPRAA